MDRRVVAQLFDCIDQIKNQNQYSSTSSSSSSSSGTQDDDIDLNNNETNKQNKPVILIAATNR